MDYADDFMARVLQVVVRSGGISTRCVGQDAESILFRSLLLLHSQTYLQFLFWPLVALSMALLVMRVS